MKTTKCLLSAGFVTALVFGSWINARAQSEITLLAPTIARKPIEHSARIGTAIHIIAQRYCKAFATLVLLHIAINFVDDSIEKIRATVDVSDDVESDIAVDACKFVDHR